MLRVATKEDLDVLVDLERQFFGGKAETREAYEVVLDLGHALIEYEDAPSGALVTVPVDNIFAHRERITSLPQKSPFRERVARGYLDEYGGYEFIAAFMSSGSYSLTRAFKKLGKAVGFCNSNWVKALDFYLKAGCEEKDTFPDVHSEGEDIVLTYERTSSLPDGY